MLTGVPELRGGTQLVVGVPKGGVGSGGVGLLALWELSDKGLSEVHLWGVLPEAEGRRLSYIQVVLWLLQRTIRD